MSNKIRYFCGCEICILATSFQASLNQWRLRHNIRLESLAEYRGQKISSDAL